MLCCEIIARDSIEERVLETSQIPSSCESDLDKYNGLETAPCDLRERL